MTISKSDGSKYKGYIDSFTASTSPLDVLLAFLPSRGLCIIHKKRNGKGSYVNAHGDSFEGNFKADKRDGTGTYLWKNGDVYSGEWQVRMIPSCKSIQL